MGDIALVNNDIVTSQFGDISLTVSDNDDIIQQARDSIFTIYGELDDHPEFGNELFVSRVKITTDMGDVEKFCESAMISDDRIDYVESVVASRTDVGNTIGISFVIITISGDRLSSDCNISIT